MTFFIIIIITKKFRVVPLGDFNIRGVDWENDFPQANSHYYTKVRGEVVHSAASFLGLSQHNLTIQNKTLLDIVFANFSCVNVTISKLDLVEPDAIHNLLDILVNTLALTMYCFTSICPLMIGPAFTMSPLRTLLLISLRRCLLML
jgi:hypothetical protein